MKSVEALEEIGTNSIPGTLNFTLSDENGKTFAYSEEMLRVNVVYAKHLTIPISPSEPDKVWKSQSHHIEYECHFSGRMMEMPLDRVF
jgi:hypothetical protein